MKTQFRNGYQIKTLLEGRLKMTNRYMKRCSKHDSTCKHKAILFASLVQKNDYQKRYKVTNAGQHVKKRKHLYTFHRNETHEAFLWLQINTSWIFLRKWQIELSCDPEAHYLALIRRKLIQYAEETSSAHSSTSPRSQEMETAQTCIS